MTKTVYQTFHLPKFLKHDWEQLSYGSVVFQVEQHALTLDKQVFCSEILQLFHKYPTLISFNFSAIETKRFERPNDNEYEPPIFEPVYQFSIDNIVWQNDRQGEASMIDLPSFENYVSNHSQFKIVYWLLKTAKENDCLCKFNGNKFHFVINKSFVNILAKQAYGENYNHFFYQHLEQDLSQHNQAHSAKSKI